MQLALLGWEASLLCPQASGRPSSHRLHLVKGPMVFSWQNQPDFQADKVPSSSASWGGDKGANGTLEHGVALEGPGSCANLIPAGAWCLRSEAIHLNILKIYAN